MATTTNFGWETPDDTDLVKDGAAAMRTLGNSIDTSFVDLKGGTTNQVLAKNSNTDLDFKWVADASGIPATIFDAKGDLIAGTAADTAGRLAVGTNGQYLSADSAETTGLKWVAAPVTTKNYSLIGTGTTTSGSTVTVSGISSQDKLLIVLDGISSNSIPESVLVRFNGDTGSNYNNYGIQNTIGATYVSGNYASIGLTGRTSINIGVIDGNHNNTLNGYLMVDGCATAGVKTYLFAGSPDGSNVGRQTTQGGFWSGSAITSVSVTIGGTFDDGTFSVYGSA